jgi:hypothetical protein
MWVAFAVLHGKNVRKICERSTMEAALEYARSHVRAGEWPSVHRLRPCATCRETGFVLPAGAKRRKRCPDCSGRGEVVFRPDIRISEIWAGVGDAMSKHEAAQKSASQHKVDLAYARWAKAQKRLMA